MNDLPPLSDSRIGRFVAESQVGDTIAVLWSSDKVPRGEMWKGVVKKIGEEKTTMLVDYAKFGELTFPPTNARLHGVEKLATDPYSAAMERVEGRETGTFEPLELSTYAMFIEAPSETRDRSFVELDAHLRRYFGIGAAERNAPRYHQDEHRKNDLLLAFLAWVRNSMKMGLVWKSDGNMAVGDNILAALVAYKVRVQHGDCRVFAQALEEAKTTGGLRGKILPAMIKAMDTKNDRTGRNAGPMTKPQGKKF